MKKLKKEPEVPYCEYHEGLPGHQGRECRNRVTQVIIIKAGLTQEGQDILFSCNRHLAAFKKEEIHVSH
jgi:hypothetical protein